MQIHKTAQDGFSNAAEAYERGRPTYPAQAMAFILRELNIHKNSVIVDLGAGTGKFTRLLAPHGQLTAIEPVQSMRQKLASQIPGIEIMDGTAEDIPLSTRTVDVLTVAQAFHWFRADKALLEIARVLKPHGRLALVWNERAPTKKWDPAISALFDRYEGSTPRFKTMKWKEAFANDKAFSPLQHRTFAFVQGGNTELMVDRVISTSFIAALPEEEREKIKAEVRSIFSTIPTPFEIPYVTHVFWCQKAAEV